MSDRFVRGDPRNEVLTEQAVTYHIESKGGSCSSKTCRHASISKPVSDTSRRRRSNGYSKRCGDDAARCASSRPRCSSTRP